MPFSTYCSALGPNTANNHGEKRHSRSKLVVKAFDVIHGDYPEERGGWKEMNEVYEDNMAENSP